VRPVPPGWSAESLVCAVRGHVAPAARARHVADDDRAIGMAQPDGTRLSRCLRCDAWVRTREPTGAAVEYEEVPPLDTLTLPRRGPALDDAIVVRLIACERLVHVAVFGLLGVVLLVVDLDLGGLRRDAATMAQSLGDVVAGSSRAGGHSWLAERLDSVAGLQDETVRALMVAALLFAALEAVEAWSLWHERRWGEYLTVVATALFLPLEVHELLERVTVIRVLLLLVNLVVLVYLVWAKRLFGLRGGMAATRHDVDWDAVLTEGAPPVDEVVAR
jgi:uncharacterized membrane protein (DUF2068 family)